jgi:hypothetical protein
MKKWIVIFPALIFFCYQSLALTSQRIGQRNEHEFYFQKDSLEAFKAFSDSFFTAVKKGDTIFLKAHILFPIKNSTFSVFDQSLENVDAITEKMLFKRLHKLFPADYLKEIRTGGDYKISTHRGKTEYSITLYHHQGGVDSNANWFFVNKNGVFYFTLFYSEAG